MQLEDNNLDTNLEQQKSTSEEDKLDILDPNSEEELTEEDIEKDLAEVVSQYSEDSVKQYLQEIIRYPLLTPEEEKTLMNTIKNKCPKTLLIEKEYENEKTSRLNVPTLFKSFVDCPSYKLVLDYLINSLDKSAEGKSNKEVELLKKYKSISNNLNRPLNFKELEQYFEIKDKNDLLSEKDLLIEAKQYVEYKKAFEKMINSNLRLVVSLAKRYGKIAHKGELLDLINDGCFGLIRAIEKFDLSYDGKFSTYAIHWVRQKIRMSALQKTDIIRIPINAKVAQDSILKKIERLCQEEQKELSYSEISEKLGVPIDKVKEALAFNQIISLDQSLNSADDESIPRVSIIPSSSNPEKESIEKMSKVDIVHLLDILSPRERKMVEMRYGLGKYTEEHALSVIGDEFGLTRERVRQIIEASFRKIKSNLKIKGMEEAVKQYIKD